MSDSSSDAEHYADRVHKCLKLVPIYKTGAFSCSSLDDDDDDEDVKRILEEHGESESKNYKTVGLSSVYRAAVEAAETTRRSTHSTNHGSSLLQSSVDQDGEYPDWDQALGNVVLVYPALSVCSRSVSEVTEACCGGATSAVVDDAGAGSVKYPCRITAARDLRKCLEGALQYGRDTGDFVVAQPHCVADKNLDFGKPRMSHKAAHESRNKVENWMSKYVGTTNSRC